MKCDELKVASLFEFEKVLSGKSNKLFYSKADVDEAIEELKDEIYNQKWRGDEWAKAANDKDKQIDELKVENRRLKRALWIARALALSRFDVDEYLRNYKHCNSRFWNDGFNIFEEACDEMQKAINIAETKCRDKAEEYK